MTASTPHNGNADLLIFLNTTDSFVSSTKANGPLTKDISLFQIGTSRLKLKHNLTGVASPGME
jgi:hypothetical protein